MTFYDPDQYYDEQNGDDGDVWMDDDYDRDEPDFDDFDEFEEDEFDDEDDFDDTDNWA